jgi:hypothetical protein
MPARACSITSPSCARSLALAATRRAPRGDGCGAILHGLLDLGLLTAGVGELLGVVAAA